METVAYTKLPGTGLRRVGFISVVAGRCQLFQGTDHLLSVDSIYGSETYKRFYFRDIQAFVVRSTPWGMVSVLAFGALAGLAALLLFANDPVALGFGVLFTTLFSILFIATLIRQLGWGGTCQTWVQTAVQIEELPSLSRVKTCRKVLARLQPLIQAAQLPAPSSAAIATDEPAPATSATLPDMPPTA
jgi:hypothetical protein